MNIKYPIIIQWPGIFAGFAAYRHVFYQSRVEVLAQIDRFEHRFYHYHSVFDGQRKKDGQAIVGAVLILGGAAYVDIIVSVAPVGRQTFFEPVYALGKESELAIAAQLDNPPNFRAPRVGFLNQKIGSET